LKKLSKGWDRDAVVATAAHFADLVSQPDLEQRPFKVSFFLTQAAAIEVIPRLESLLQQGLDTKLIYSAGQDLDIIPRCSDKGLAMQFCVSSGELRQSKQLCVVTWQRYRSICHR
jgi:sucrose-6F-phosphate phosphohydrolase